MFHSIIQLQTTWLIAVTISTLAAQTAIADEVTTPSFPSTLYSYAQRLKPLPSYPYPYPDLSQRLAAEGKTYLPLFTYGSLLDRRSAGLTLSPQALASSRPVLGFGIKRIFNRNISSTKSAPRWGYPFCSNARGMLNVQPTDNLESFVNGVLIEVPLADLSALLKREVGYDLIPIVITDWNAFLVGEYRFSIAYTLHAPAGSTYTDSHILPQPAYYELTRNAARQFGPFFELLWYSTTYLADGTTPVAIWERWSREGDSRTKLIQTADQNKPDPVPQDPL